MFHTTAWGLAEDVGGGLLIFVAVVLAGYVINTAHQVADVARELRDTRDVVEGNRDKLARLVDRVDQLSNRTSN